jgi:hypothetical protein
MEWDDNKRKVLNRVGLLCLALTNDYRRENYWRINRIEDTQGVTLETKFARRELDNNLDIGLFVIDCEKRNKKYFKVSMINEDLELTPHAFVDFTTSRVHRVKGKSADKNVHWDLDDCIRLCDWRGYYLNKDPE